MASNTESSADDLVRTGPSVTDGECHTFLLAADGGLNGAARAIPTLREYINDLPNTAATFRLTHIDDITSQSLEREHAEFVYAWPVHNIHAGSGPRSFVNPNHIHAHRYTDIVTRCECGTLLTRNYDDDNNPLRDEHNHFAECLPHYRLRARADMTEQRYQRMLRLGKLGWKGSQMAPRFGVGESSMSSFAERFNTDLRSVYDQYKEIAANTYTYLVRDCGVPASTVADVYGHARSTMTRWAKTYTEYETKRGANQFTRNDGGEFTWVETHEADTSQKPPFMRDDSPEDSDD